MGHYEARDGLVGWWRSLVGRSVSPFKQETGFTNRPDPNLASVYNLV